MLVVEVLLRGEDLLQVALHEVRHDVHIVERALGRRDEVLDGDDVLVLREVLQEADLAQYSLGVENVHEDVGHLLHRHPPPRLGVRRRAHHAVRAHADLLEAVVVLGDRHGSGRRFGPGGWAAGQLCVGLARLV